MDKEDQAQTSEMHLGAFWEHNKVSKALATGEGLDQLELKNINVRIVGIPQLESVSVGPNWTVEEMRYILAKESGIKHDDIDLYFGGDRLVPEIIISNCGILQDSIITVVIHSRA